MNVPHKVVHNIVHVKPAHPRTCMPVNPLNATSTTAPTPIRRKNPPVIINSIPLPIPHTRIWCWTADTANAPTNVPGFPKSTPPGRAPKVTKRCRRNWCQRKLQNSWIEVDIHGLPTDGQAYWVTYCDASNAVNFKSVLTAIKAIEVDGVLSRGNGLEDHDHPTPRWFCKRSNASRRTFEGDKDRSMKESR
ncbi:hypothetical protein BC827DRAFT_1153215 [Russula dissimulans]|nr:hypothetical protein BC827DRAFT_1153215 [Russula dissimulans]